jgi:hypothetical protein
MDGVDAGGLLPALTAIVSGLIDRDGVTIFLESIDLPKDNRVRVVAWLIALGVLPIGPQAIVDWFADHIVRYKALVLAKLGDNANSPTSSLAATERSLIEMDLHRGLPTAARQGRLLGLADDDLAGGELRCARILTLLSLTSPKFSYTQGFDRFATVTYLLTLNFAARLNLPRDLAEAFSFHLCEQIITMSSAFKMLDNPADTFARLDRAIKNFLPELWASLKQAGHTSLHFAFRWRMLMFADDHDICSLLLIWDQLIAHRHKYTRYMESLCIAHMSQVPFNDTVFMVGEIQSFRDWDIVQIIKNANKLSHPEPLVSGRTLALVAAVVVVVAGIGLFIRRHRKEKDRNK